MTIFPSGGFQELARYHNFDPSGVPVSGQYLSLIDEKEHYLERSIDPSGTLDVWNSPARLEAGKFAVVGDLSPGIHEVYVDYAIGYTKFNAAETWTSAYLDYTSLGSVPSASGFNLANETIEAIETQLLAGAPSGQTRFDVIESFNTGVSGILDDHITTDIDDAHPGILSESKLPSGVVYASGLPTLDLGIADPSGQTTLSDHFQNHPHPYWQDLIRASGNAQTIADYVDIIGAALVGVSGQLHSEIVGVSGQLEADLLAASGVLQSEIDAHLADVANPHAVTATQVGLGSVENTALSTWGGSSNLTTIGPQNNITVSGVIDNGAGTDISVQQARDAFNITVASNVIIVGGQAVWASGLTFDISPAEYYIHGTRYSYAGGQVTLVNADLTYSRFDLIYLDSGSLAGSVSGVPSANPVRPDVDSDTQVAVTFVLVPAGASEPQVDQTNIYFENAEWTFASSAGSIVGDSTNNPYAGTYSVEGTGVAKNTTFDFSTTSIDLSSVNLLSLYLAPKAAFGNLYLQVAWRNNGSLISNWVTIDDGLYGFDENNTAYQQITIPLGDFGLSSSTADELEFQIKGSNGNIGFYLDNIFVQEGIPTQAAQNIWKTIEGNSGSVAADNPQDLLKVYGERGILTSVDDTTDVLTIKPSGIESAAIGDVWQITASGIPTWGFGNNLLAVSGVLQSQISANASGVNYNTLVLVDAVSGVLQGQITSNDADIAALQTASGVLSTSLGTAIGDIATNNAWAIAASGNLQTQITGLDSSSHAQNTDTGTTEQDWHINTASPSDEMILRASGGWLLVGQASPFGYGNLRAKNIQVQGTLSYQNQDILQVEDPWIELNIPVSGSPLDPIDGGLRLNRTSGPDAVIMWESTNGVWHAGISGQTNPIITASGSLADLATKNHSDLTLNDGSNPHGTTTDDTGGMPSGVAQAHFNNTNNPHNVTLEQLAAAPSGQLQAHLDDTNNPHVITLEQLAAAPSGMVQSHLDDFNNPHQVTQEQLSVAPSGWVQSHINNTSNPHSVTKSQIGLGSVENTALSTWAGTTNINTLGTIGTGTWQGNPIASGYLDANIAYLDQNETITGTWLHTGPTSFIYNNYDVANLEIGRSTSNSLRIYSFAGAPTASNWHVWNGSSEVATITIYNAASAPYDRGDVHFKQDVFIDGVINTGTWQGTAIDAAYLDAQLAEKDQNETITGSWTYSYKSGSIAAVEIQSGDGANEVNNYIQVALGYNSTANYRHNIRTRHNAGAQADNAIAFYVWKQGTDATGTMGSQQVLDLGYDTIAFTTSAASINVNGNAVWHAGNDGASSGLDADLLDGYHESSFGKLADAESVAGAWSFAAGVSVGTSQFLGLWGATATYGFHMGTSSDFNYGPVTGYSIKTCMNSTAGRGFTWGIQNSVPIAALSNTGQFQCASTLAALGGLSTNGANFYSINESASASTLVARTSNGYIYCNYINLNGSDTTNIPTAVWIETGSDNWVRAQTWAYFKSYLYGPYAVGSIPVHNGGTPGSADITFPYQINFDTTYNWLDTYAGFRVTTGTTASPSSVTRGLITRDNLTTDHFWAYVDSPADDRYRLTGQTVFTRAIEGEVYTGTLLHIPMPREGRIVGVYATLAGRPTGANFQVDVRKNGTATTDSIFSSDTPISITTAQSASNGIYQSSGTLDSARTPVGSSDIIFVVITQIGSTFPGSDFVIQIEVA